MKKSDAINLLGGTASTARAIGISAAAVSLWPDQLPPRIADRVQAALWRKQHGDGLPMPDLKPPKRSKAKEAAHG